MKVDKKRNGKAVVYDGLTDASIIMQGIPYGLPEQSIIVAEFAHKETPDGKAIFEIAQDGNQILVNGETVSALCSVLKNMLKRSETFEDEPEASVAVETCKWMRHSETLIINPHTKDAWRTREGLVCCMNCGKKIEVVK